MELSVIITQIKEGTNWKSESRIVGEACEEYIKTNMKCVRCTGSFGKCKTNEKSVDLFCLNCGQKYQIKAKCTTPTQLRNIMNKNMFKTIGGDYSTTVNNICENIDYFIILYGKDSYEIYNILYSKKENMNTECIVPRKPLAPTAKRAGWQGCIIIFNHFEVLI